MRVIMVMFDSLNRKFLSSYGCEQSVTPNFQRLSELTVTFDNFYGGSLPCIPARRELQTGRYNFLHRSWGPMEPFDDSLPQILSNHGIYTHLVTDHCHYWQEGGSTYHTRFSSCDFIRGQEGDFWYGDAAGFTRNLDLRRQDAINRLYMPEESDCPHARTFRSGLCFLEKNVENQNWFLQLEYFDPHEPYFAPQRFREMYGAREDGLDWPYYGKVSDRTRIEDARLHYMALVTMCDEYLGKILDFMDSNHMWNDTMLIVNTDHGFLLGEHSYFAKNYMPCYDEIVHIPFFIWDPRTGRRNARCSNLAQTIDIAPTILDYFGIKPTKDMQGLSLGEAAANGGPARDYALFGCFGKHVNITDGRYVYMRSAKRDVPLNNYTIVPLNILTPFSLEELQQSEITPPDAFGFSKGIPLLKIPTCDTTAPDNSIYSYSKHKSFGDLLFDLQTDPAQESPIDAPEVEQRLICKMREMMAENEAPSEQLERMGL